MKIILLAVLFLCVTLFANIDNNFTDTNDSSVLKTLPEDKKIEEDTQTQDLPKVIYLSYDKIPKRVLKGEIFSVTIKSLSTVKDFVDITYELSNEEGVKHLSDFPSRDMDSKYFYETFHFLATADDVRLPDFTATLLDYNDNKYKKTTLEGKRLNVISLNPKEDFSNIIANSFDIIEYKTTAYDDKRNIVIFVATATNCDISAFKLNGVYKQGVESIIESYFDSKITYYAIIDKTVQNLSFSYFNLKKNRFLPIDIPIIVNDDSVTTQSDLKPKNQSHEILKMGVAASVALIAFFMILWRRRYIYLIFIFIPLGYIIYIGMPSKEICIKQGSNIYLLPVNNGTVFETTSTKYKLPKEDEIKNWTKVQLKNQKIGWVKNEDICSR